MRTDGRMDGRMVTWLPKFLGSINYQMGYRLWSSAKNVIQFFLQVRRQYPCHLWTVSIWREISGLATVKACVLHSWFRIKQSNNNYSLFFRIKNRTFGAMKIDVFFCCFYLFVYFITYFFWGWCWGPGEFFTKTEILNRLQSFTWLFSWLDIIWCLLFLVHARVRCWSVMSCDVSSIITCNAESTSQSCLSFPNDCLKVSYCLAISLARLVIVVVLDLWIPASNCSWYCSLHFIHSLQFPSLPVLNTFSIFVRPFRIFACDSLVSGLLCRFSELMVAYQWWRTV